MANSETVEYAMPVELSVICGFKRKREALINRRTAYPRFAANRRHEQCLDEPRQSEAEQDVKNIRPDGVANAHRAMSLCGDDDR